VKSCADLPETYEKTVFMLLEDPQHNVRFVHLFLPGLLNSISSIAHASKDRIIMNNKLGRTQK
jgi:hypothetical protein